MHLLPVTGKIIYIERNRHILTFSSSNLMFRITCLALLEMLLEFFSISASSDDTFCSLQIFETFGILGAGT
jgi:hypothetical protein